MLLLTGQGPGLLLLLVVGALLLIGVRGSAGRRSSFAPEELDQLLSEFSVFLEARGNTTASRVDSPDRMHQVLLEHSRRPWQKPTNSRSPTRQPENWGFHPQPTSAAHINGFVRGPGIGVSDPAALFESRRAYLLQKRSMGMGSAVSTDGAGGRRGFIRPPSVSAMVRRLLDRRRSPSNVLTPVDTRYSMQDMQNEEVSAVLGDRRAPKTSRLHFQDQSVSTGPAASAAPLHLGTQCSVLQEIDAVSEYTAFFNSSCLVDCCNACGSQVVCNSDGLVEQLLLLPSAGSLSPAALVDLTNLTSLHIVTRELFLQINASGRSIDDFLNALPSDPDISPLEQQELVKQGGGMSGPLPNVVLPPTLEDIILLSPFGGSFPSAWFSRGNPHLHRCFALATFDDLSMPAAVQPRLQTLVIIGSMLSPLPMDPIPFFPAAATIVLSGRFNGPLPTLSAIPSGLRVLTFSGYFTGSLVAIWPALCASGLTALQLRGLLSGDFPDVSLLPAGMTELQLQGLFESPIGSDWSKFASSIQVLSIWTSFAQELPAEVLQLPHLRILDIAGPFSGSLLSLAPLEQLHFLALAGLWTGNLSSLDLCSLQHLSVLRVLAGLGGVVPSCLPLMSSLTVLDLTGEFSGPLPVLPAVSPIFELVLSGHFDQGTVPGYCKSMGVVWLLDISTFPLMPVEDPTFISTCLSALVDGGALLIAGNLSTAIWEVPENVSASLSIKLCCKGQIPPGIFEAILPHASTLDLSGNSFVSPFLVVSSPSLEVLVVDYSNVATVNVRQPVSSLYLLSFVQNLITAIDGLSAALNLSVLTLRGNLMTGPVPILVDTCSYRLLSLVAVDVSYNKFNALLVSEICPLPQMISFTASSNRLAGPLPKLFSFAAPSMGKLDLSNNTLEGYIPDEYSFWSNLFELQLIGNSGLQPLLSRNVHVNGAPYLESAGIECPAYSLQTVSQANAAVYFDASSTDYSGCFCLLGYYGVPPNCTFCGVLSTMTDCPGEGYIFAPTGYWLTPPLDLVGGTIPQYVLPCLDAGSPSSVCKLGSLGDPSICSEGHEGRLCFGCSAGYYVAGSRCMPCGDGSTKAWPILVLYSIFVACIGLSGVWISVFSNRTAQSQVIIEFLQYLAFLSAPLPFSVRSTSAVFSVFALRMGVYSCVIPGWSLTAQFVANVLVPFSLQFFCFAAFCYRWLTHGRTQRARIVGNTLQHSLWILHATLLSVSLATVELFVCERDSGLGQSYFITHPNEVCDNRLRFAAGCIFVLAVAAPMSAYAYVLWTRRKLTSFENKDLFQRGTFITDLTAYSACLYKDGWPLWDVVVMARRVLFSFAYASLPAGDAFRPWLVCLLLSTFLFCDRFFSVYRDERVNVLQQICWVVLFWNFGSALYFRIPSAEHINEVSWIFFIFNALFVGMLVITWVRWIVQRMLARWRERRMDNILRHHTVDGTKGSMEMELLKA